jgi:hypothetical protein
MPKILLIGGHGKVALKMTPLLCLRGWAVTSVIRDPSQAKDVLNSINKILLSYSGKDKVFALKTLPEDIELVKSEKDAKSILDKVNPDWVIWSAGIYPLFPFPVFSAKQQE